ncbi:MAG: hypothetical protein M1350_07750 [Actinobacteria bacterium]|nr:hypothetical protein [Actinomycetota bacterium]
MAMVVGIREGWRVLPMKGCFERGHDLVKIVDRIKCAVRNVPFRSGRTAGTAGKMRWSDG